MGVGCQRKRDFAPGAAKKDARTKIAFQTVAAIRGSTRGAPENVRKGIIKGGTVVILCGGKREERGEAED